MFPASDDKASTTGAVAYEDRTPHWQGEGTTHRRNGDHNATTWRWRVEPGKEETFEHLRSWFLPYGQEAAVEHVKSGRRPQETPGGRRGVRWGRDRRAFSRQPSFVRGGARLAGRVLLRAGQRLLQWGGGADEIEASAA